MFAHSFVRGRLLAALTVLHRLVYPLVVTGYRAGTAFPRQAAGSLIDARRQAVGSRLIGQSFTDPKYFWGRPSATTPQPYNGSASTGSNLGPLNPALIDGGQGAHRGAARRRSRQHGAPIPVDLVTASASGLDPDISLAAAHYQARAGRARARPR